MKMRLGFISNSSSSSYIVEIRGISEEDFLNKLFNEYSWNYFDKSVIEKDLLKSIKNNKTSKRKSEKFPPQKPFSDMYDRWIKDSENDFARFKDTKTNEDLARFILEHNGITIKSDKENVELYAWTSMHNDFNDGMSQLLREIVLFFMFDTTHKVKGRRIDES
jgi:hypothetical protein